MFSPSGPDLPRRAPAVVMSVAAALALYALVWPVPMQDLANDYVPWLRHIIAAGPLTAFSTPFASYNPPYLYALAIVSPLHALLSLMSVIKTLSVIGTVAMACAMARLLRTLEVKDAERWAALILVLPTAMLNAGLLAQCDAMWAAPCLCALDAAIRRRPVPMLAWCGVALAFKLQAILFAPFVMAMLLHHRVPVWRWFIVPAIFLASLLPAWLVGWPAGDLLGIYAFQAGSFPRLALNAPNVWSIVQALVPADAPRLSGLAMASAIGASAAYIAYFSVRMPRGAAIVPVALLGVLIPAGLLPHMHERYFFLADMIAFAWAVTARDRPALHVAILVQCGSTAALAAYLFDGSALAIAGAVMMILATLQIARPLVKPAANDNPLLARAA